MARYLRKSGVVDAFHLSKELPFEELTQGLADFVSEAPGDWGVSIRANKVTLTNRAAGIGWTADVGDYIAIQAGHLIVWDREDFNSIHEYVSG